MRVLSVKSPASSTGCRALTFVVLGIWEGGVHSQAPSGPDPVWFWTCENGGRGPCGSVMDAPGARTAPDGVGAQLRLRVCAASRLALFIRTDSCAMSFPLLSPAPPRHASPKKPAKPKNARFSRASSFSRVPAVGRSLQSCLMLGFFGCSTKAKQCPRHKGSLQDPSVLVRLLFQRGENPFS